MDIKQYLDSTYLKTSEQSLISEKENDEIVKAAIKQNNSAINHLDYSLLKDRNLKSLQMKWEIISQLLRWSATAQEFYQ